MKIAFGGWPPVLQPGRGEGQGRPRPTGVPPASPGTPRPEGDEVTGLVTALLRRLGWIRPKEAPPDVPLNLYGDETRKITGHHGVDVGSQRLDDLDRAALRFALDQLDATGGARASEQKPLQAADIGCGYDTQGVRLALMGYDVTLVDIADLAGYFNTLESNLFLQGKLNFHRQDARALDVDGLNKRFRLLFSQRFIHYLPFNDAAQLLSRLNKHLEPEGRLFLSASGLNSELGGGYPGRDTPLPNRHARLAKGMAEKHQIHEPVCLYRPEDLETLGREAGLEPERVFSSAFGNVKGVFRKAPG